MEDIAIFRGELKHAMVKNSPETTKHFYEGIFARRNELDDQTVRKNK